MISFSQCLGIIVECFSGIDKYIIARIQRRIQNPLKRLRWIFSQKYLTIFNRYLLLKKCHLRCQRHRRNSNTLHFVVQRSQDTKLRHGNLMPTFSDTYLTAKNLIRMFYILIFISVDTMAPRFQVPCAIQNRTGFCILNLITVHIR